MLRASISLCFVFIFSSSLMGFCQGIPQWCPPDRYRSNPCVQRPTVRPIVRTVQVDVPAPCPTVSCGPALPWRPHPCAPPTCAPPPPTRPVRVRIDVRVRPESCGQGQHAQVGCRNFGALTPFMELMRRALAAPINILETMCPGMPRCGMPPPPCGPPSCMPSPCGPAPMCPPAPCGPMPCRYPQKVKCSTAGYAPCPPACGPYPYQVPRPMYGGPR